MKQPGNLLGKKYARVVEKSPPAIESTLEMFGTRIAKVHVKQMKRMVHM